MIVINWSILGACGTDLRGYLGSLESLRVFGRWKETEYRVLRFEVERAPCRTAFLAALAFLSLVEPLAVDLALGVFVVAISKGNAI